MELKIGEVKLIGVTSKEYARLLRENSVKDDRGNIVCSPELWDSLASIIERSDDTIKEFAEEILSEIHEALISNHNARNERANKNSDINPFEDTFYQYCNGKIDALEGISAYIKGIMESRSTL